MWFVYDPDNGFELFQSEEAAKRAFDERITVWREYCDEIGEWHPDVERVCMGRVTHEVVLQEVDLDPDYLLHLIEYGAASECDTFCEAFVREVMPR